MCFKNRVHMLSDAKTPLCIISHRWQRRRLKTSLEFPIPLVGETVGLPAFGGPWASKVRLTAAPRRREGFCFLFR